MTSIKCNKCGASIEIEPGTKFAKCEYCNSQMYIDKSGVGFFYIVEMKIKEENARGIFKRWSAGSAMAKDLENEAKIVKMIPEYFPLYMFKRNVEGKEAIYFEPAKSTSLPGMHALKVPAGDIKIFDQNYIVDPRAQIIQPDLGMDAYLNNLPGKAEEQALVFFPIWYIEYSYKGNIYNVVIDASSGEVFSEKFPTRESYPYIAVASLGFFLFLIYGIISLFWKFTYGLIGMAITTPILFLASYFVAKNM
ncbi:MAG: zinc ribbon domain-containing protein [Thermoplasmatales archaeon]|nr:zinc ribbon domain-containing protein [Thermoplasmatales archaeon]